MHLNSSVLFITLAAIMYHSSSGDCRPAESSSQLRTLHDGLNYYKKDWPGLSSSASSWSNRTYQRAQVRRGPGRSRVHHRDFRRRTMTRFTPLHTDGAQTPDHRMTGQTPRMTGQTPRMTGLGPNPKTSEPTRVYSPENEGQDELCTPLQLRVGRYQSDAAASGRPIRLVVGSTFSIDYFAAK